MSNVNDLVLQEISFEDIKNHVVEHKKKYAALAAALAGAYGGHLGYKKYKHYKRKHDIIEHLKRNRETYAGAAIGAGSSLASSDGTDHRFVKAVGGGLAGGLAGALLQQARRENEHKLSKK